MSNDTADDKAPKSVKIDVDIDEETSMGEYVNMARIFHTHSEFILDALFLPPGSKRAKVRSRLILSPAHAKHLLAALNQNVQLYEKKFGEIKLPAQGGGPILH